MSALFLCSFLPGCGAILWWSQSLQSSQAMQERVTQIQAQLSTSQDEVSQLREKNQILSQQVVKMESHTIEVNALRYLEPSEPHKKMSYG